jgi:hypothetical protein
MNMDFSGDKDFYCSELSQELDEPLFGTAVNADVWFLLEVNQPWLAKATTENKLSNDLRQWLGGLVEAGEKSRLQFIRHAAEHRSERLAFFVALADETSPSLYKFEVDTHEELFDLNVAAITRGDEDYHAFRSQDPLFLVCTNGKRDRCCARFGASLYRNLLNRVGPAAWQTTHLGGHRFAATATVMPNGVNYGRLQAGDVGRMVEAQARGSIILEKLRGRHCFDPIVQTAEYFLRRETDDHQLLSYRHKGTTVEGEDISKVQFTSLNGEIHRIVLQQHSQPLELFPSCGQTKGKTRHLYRLLKHQVL